MFKPPPDAEIYTEQVLQRCRDLIENSVWQDLHVQRLAAWHANFSGITDRYFAARLLDSLIYRSAPQTKALIDYLFLRVLPEIARTAQLECIPSNDWLTPFRQSCPHKSIRFIPVIRSVEPPTKSGPVIARMIAKRLRFNERNIIWPFQIEKAISDGATTFVLLDDFLGTGDQFTKFCKAYNLSQFFASATFIYAPFVAHSTGITTVKRYDNRVFVAAAETLDVRHQLFSEGCDCFLDGENSLADARNHYVDLLTRLGILERISEKVWYGYGGLELAFAFSHASPNNSLPIMWWRGERFTPLFDR
jgi:hypothetical protein